MQNVPDLPILLTRLLYTSVSEQRRIHDPASEVENIPIGLYLKLGRMESIELAINVSIIVRIPQKATVQTAIS
jgi:hypothetical protein